MNIIDVIKHFSELSIAPIDIEEHIVPVLLGAGVRDQIHVWEVDVDSRHLRGKLVHWEPWEYSDDWAYDFDRPRCVADIYIAKELTNEWKRLIASKELFHILDPVENRVRTEEEVEKLISEIGLPVEKPGTILDYKSATDTLGLYEALAVLFPWEVRNKLRERLAEDPKFVEEIAKYVELPLEHVYLVMSDAWDFIYRLLRRELEAVMDEIKKLMPKETAAE